MVRREGEEAEAVEAEGGTRRRRARSEGGHDGEACMHIFPEERVVGRQHISYYSKGGC